MVSLLLPHGVMVWLFFAFLFCLDYTWKLRYNNTMRRIFITATLLALFGASLWVVFEYGFYWQSKTQYAQLTFISTIALIVLPIILIFVNWLGVGDERAYQEKKWKERRDEERAYQEKLKAEEERSRIRKLIERK